jgi:hypothetical protein
MQASICVPHVKAHYYANSSDVTDFEYAAKSRNDDYDFADLPQQKQM